MPAFYHRHLGLSYGEAYYFDPGYRAEVECAEARFLFEILGRHGVGSRSPQPSTSIFIQPVDLIMRTQGAEWRFPPDGTVESWGTPWAGLAPAEVARLDAGGAAQHPVIDAVLKQYREMERLYGDAADIFGTKSGTMTTHTPYTTAHQLYGEELFVRLLTDPAGARTILDKAWEIYQAVLGRIAAATGAQLTRIHMGDCSASLLSADTYAKTVLPVNRELAARFAAAGYHSCGASSHLLSTFASIPGVDLVQLGPGTDLAEAAAHLPGRHLQPLVNPLLMGSGTPDAVAAHVRALLAHCAPAPATTLCVWSLDRDTPIPNVDALYNVVESSAGDTTV